MDAEDRPLNFVPQQFDAMRKIPLYGDTLKERFERCLDLYLCPRAKRKRMNIDPDSLLPQVYACACACVKSSCIITTLKKPFRVEYCSHILYHVSINNVDKLSKENSL